MKDGCPRWVTRHSGAALGIQPGSPHPLYLLPQRFGWVRDAPTSARLRGDTQGIRAGGWSSVYGFYACQALSTAWYTYKPALSHCVRQTQPELHPPCLYHPTTPRHRGEDRGRGDKTL